MIIIYRIDDRLIHGQVQTSWIKEFKINRIIIIDDQVCNDEMTKMVLKIAKPPQAELVVCGTDKAITLLKKDASQEKARTLVIFKTITTLKTLVEQGWDIKEAVLGPTANKEGTVQIAKNTYFTQKEVEAAKYLVEKGVNVYSQLLPSESKVSLETILGKL